MSGRLRHGIFLAPFDDFAVPSHVLEAAHLAEDRGWDGLFLWDHVQRPEVRPVADPWVLLAAVATVTQRLLLGPMVTPIARRRPQKLAREVLTLDHLSRGRLILGLGLGVDTGRELSAFGEVVDPAARGRLLDEGLEVLGGLLSGEEVHHRGEFFTADGVRFEPTPVRPSGVPIWLAARSTARAPLRRAAAQSGLFPIEVGPEEVAEMLGVVASMRGSLDGFDVATVDGPDRDPVAFAAAGVTWWMSAPPPDHSYAEVMAVIEAGPRAH
jgi:alkanesulfonate monooxygenase SsuD/methylene tetrahydromethanopterin reductase-like flavin-dependent oxidoreductase (luciferase family)